MTGSGSHTTSRREILAVTVGLAAVIGLQLTVADGWYLLRQWFWMDEWFTFLIADRATFRDMWIAYSASELHPPLYPVVVWGASRLAGQASEPVLRVVSLASVFSALVGSYLLLRRSFRIDVALAAVACLWSLDALLFHAFDARYYGLWLASAVWFAWFVARTQEDGRGSRLGLFASAFALCGVHLFGLLVWTIVMTAAFLAGTATTGRQRIGALLPACVGALLAAALLALNVGHRHSFESASWIAPVTGQTAVAFVASLLLPSQLALASVFGGAALILGRTVRPVRPDPSGSRVLLLSFGALPLAVVALSALVAPVTMERYAFPVVLSTAVIAATALSRAPVAVVLVCAILWLGQSTLGIRRSAEFNRAVDSQSAALVAQVRQLLDRGDAVLFESLQQYSMVDRYAPDLRDQVQVLDFERDDVRPGLSTRTGLRETLEVRLFERNLARVTAATHGRPRVVRLDTVRANSSTVWLILRRDDEPVVWAGARVLSKEGRLARVEFTP